MDLESFDVIQFLEDQSIAYSESGENVSTGWIGINCPFCDDALNHLGINRQTKVISCFKCGTTGNIIKLIQEINNCSVFQAITVVKKYQDKSLSYLDIPERQTSSSKVILPKGSSKIFPGIFQNYFRERNFDLDYLTTKFDLYACHISSDIKFKYRIIAPVYQNHELVTYVGRDVTGKAQTKYQNCPLEYSLISIKDCLYNLDSIKDKAIIVEGITDVWRLGDGAVATFGTQFTEKQVSLLTRLEKVFVMYDSDAIEVSHRLANELTGICKNVEVIELSQGDPASFFSPEEALKLKQELFS